MAAPLFLGLDLSTQSLTALAVEAESDRVHDWSLVFDRDLPVYGTRHGVLPHPDPLVVHADPRMWAEALDTLLLRLAADGQTPRVAGIALSAQQHGTVYLTKAFTPRLAALDPARPLAAQLEGIFSRPTAPIWMDASTAPECAELDAALGGGVRFASLTGSVATERFAGPQIRRFHRTDPEAYARTAHIALVSSYVTSLLCGAIAPVDAGDGYGTNLADIRNGRWLPEAMAAAAPNLEVRLPPLLTQDRVVGRVAPYAVRRYGLPARCPVMVGTGDNPSSLVGLGLLGVTDRRAVSLGTSDTVFGYIPEVRGAPPTGGHVFGTADGGGMFLICFKNGSLARERIRQDFGLSWDDFARVLLETPPGNQGRILLPYYLPEITPPVHQPGVRRFGGLEPHDLAGHVRGVAEAQAMAMVLHSAWAGPRPRKLLVTAGGSENDGLLQVLAEVFDAEVAVGAVSNSAAMGAALRAAHGALEAAGTPVAWEELARRHVRESLSRRVRPRREAVAVYHGPDGLLQAYAACERAARDLGGDPAGAIARFKRAHGG